MNFIATDANSNTITVGDLFDCRIAAAEWVLENEAPATVENYDKCDDDDLVEINILWADVEAAVAEARDWLMTDNGDDENLTDDLTDALDNFDVAIDNGSIKRALAACVSFSYDWASGDRSGFEKLNALASR